MTAGDFVIARQRRSNLVLINRLPRHINVARNDDSFFRHSKGSKATEESTNLNYYGFFATLRMTSWRCVDCHADKASRNDARVIIAMQSQNNLANKIYASINSSISFCIFGKALVAGSI